MSDSIDEPSKDARLVAMVQPPRRCADIPDLALPGAPPPDFETYPEDFRVEELADPQRDAVGDERSAFVRFDLFKRGMTTSEAIGIVAGACHRPRRDFAFAGMKDKWAETRQWVTAPREIQSALERFRHPRIELSDMQPWARNLSRAELLGNRFTVTLRNCRSDAPALLEQKLARLGGRLDNYYGPQRFGHGLETLTLGLRHLREGPGSRRHTGKGRGKGRPKDRRDAKLEFALHAAQAGLFNLYAALRSERARAELDDEWALRGLSGERWQASWGDRRRVGSPEALAEQTTDVGELSPSGPMLGRRLPPAPEGSLAAALESEALARAELRLEDFEAFGALLPGSHRPLWVQLRGDRGEHPGPGTGVRTEMVGDDLRQADAAPAKRGTALRLHFSLPAGSYATTLLRELLGELR